MLLFQTSENRLGTKLSYQEMRCIMQDIVGIFGTTLLHGVVVVRYYQLAIVLYKLI